MRAGSASDTVDDWKFATGMPPFDHLRSLVDGRGLFEHARFAQPRPEHGYCLDDVSRALIVVCRESDPYPEIEVLARQFLDFTLSALQPDGRCHNRMRVDGTWSDEPAPGDWWGRAVWGLGVASAHASTAQLRSDALTGFRRAAQAQPSGHLRESVFAALGAAEVLTVHPDEHRARELLEAAVRATEATTVQNATGLAGPATASGGVSRGPGSVPVWPWPEPRLTYANGSVVEALLLAGDVLPDAEVLTRGLRLLEFLVDVETRAGHLSVTPVGGRGPGTTGPEFDQQPIEVAALVDACARAHALTGDDRWRECVRMGWAWFLGDNDALTPMVDLDTGGGFDGLHRHGRNKNQGAESTLAAISTAQQARRLGLLA